jgi:hypothetical protein
MTTPRDLIPALQERFAALGYQPDTPLYRVTVDDLLTILAKRLVERNTPVDALTTTDLEAMLDQVTSYLNGEGMPWTLVITLGMEDGWPKHPTTHPEKT